MKKMFFIMALGVAVITATLMLSTSAYAICGKQCKQAKNYCKSYEKSNPGQKCGTARGAICTGKSWKKIKQVNIAWSACRLVKGQDDLKKGQARCSEFKKHWGGKCETHSPRCKAGWVKLGKYGKFRACRPIEVSLKHAL